jgi:hypothetical protein
MDRNQPKDPEIERLLLKLEDGIRALRVAYRSSLLVPIQKSEMDDELDKLEEAAKPKA